MLIPALAGATFSIITEPGGKTNVPVWQSATLASLFGFAGFWGVSMGYYRAGRPGYATFSGLGRMALLAGGIGLDRWAMRGCNEEEHVCDGFPVGALLSLVAVIGWSASDYQRLDEAVRTKARTSTWTALPMVTASPEGGLRAGLVGRF